MLRKIVTACGLVLCFLLQSCVFTKFHLGNIVPNLLLILTSVLGLMRGEKEGLVVGFFSGLLLDIFFGNLLGFHALLLMYIGFMCGKFCGMFFPEDIKLPLALVVTSCFTNGFLNYLFLFFFRGKFQFVTYLTRIIVPEVLYTILVSIVMYPIILKLYQSFERMEIQRNH